MFTSVNSKTDAENSCCWFNSLNFFFKSIISTIFLSSVCYANTVSLNVSDSVNAASEDVALEGSDDQDDDNDDDKKHKDKSLRFLKGCNDRQLQYGKKDVCLELKDGKTIVLCLFPKAADKLIAKDFKKKNYYYKNGDTCDNNNETPVCGNQILETGEACDEGNIQTATCESNCSLPACGDGVLNQLVGEECDDGNLSNNDNCDSNCKIITPNEAICGDFVIEGNEECDDGGVDTTSCNFNCSLSECGDGIVNSFAGEDCDDGNVADNDSCPSNCKLLPINLAVCGNGTIEGNEQCDDGNSINNDGCSAACTDESTSGGSVCPCFTFNDLQQNLNQYCDGELVNEFFFTTPEDYNNVDPFDTVFGTLSFTDFRQYSSGELAGGGGNLSLLFASGDDVFAQCSLTYNSCDTNPPVEISQQYIFSAADGNPCIKIVQDYLNSRNPSAFCGNNIVDNGEECDEGRVQTASCEADCKIPQCGDNIVNQLAGEQCDGGANCSPECTILPENPCGNFVINDDEQCDDGNAIDGDGCSSTCQCESLGNQTLVVAYTDLDGVEGYSEANDILISKLVDSNNDSQAGICDTIVTNQFPTDKNAQTYSDASVTEFKAYACLNFPSEIKCVTLDNETFFWNRFVVPEGDNIGELVRERYIEYYFPISTTSATILSDSAVTDLKDDIGVSTQSPSSPAPGVTYEIFTPEADDSFIDIRFSQ